VNEDVTVNEDYVTMNEEYVTLHSFQGLVEASKCRINYGTTRTVTSAFG